MNTAIALLVGGGFGLTIYALLSQLLSLLERAYLLRHSAGFRAASMLRRPDSRQDPLRLERYPWLWIRLSGVALFVMLSVVLKPALLILAPLGYLLPELGLRRYLERRVRGKLRLEVRDLLQELRLLLAVGTSLGPALAQATRNPDGLLRQTLAAEIGGDVYGRLPEQILAAVAQRLGSEDLRQTLARLESARQGTESYQEALSEAVAEISASIAEEAEVAVEGAPTRLVAPMLVCLLLPVLILGFYPPLTSVVAAIAGTPTG